MSSEYIFVYGSLRKGFSSPVRSVLDDHAEFIGEAIFQGKLYQIDWYPGVVSSGESNDIVYGEVYKIIEEKVVLSTLDRYEGCTPLDPKPHAFVRKKMPIQLKKDGERMAWIYLYNLPVDDKVYIPSGDYQQYKR